MFGTCKSFYSARRRRRDLIASRNVPVAWKIRVRESRSSSLRGVRSVWPRTRWTNRVWAQNVVDSWPWEHGRSTDRLGHDMTRCSMDSSTTVEEHRRQRCKCLRSRTARSDEIDIWPGRVKGEVTREERTWLQALKCSIDRMRPEPGRSPVEKDMLEDQYSAGNLKPTILTMEHFSIL